MFEGIVSKILVRVLGDYIEDVDSHNLKLSFLSGDVELHNLKMKSTALDMFDLPVTVVWGYVGTIKAKIPWQTIGTSPVSFDVSDIYIVVQPRKCIQYDEKTERERAEKARIARLHNYELQKITRDLASTTTTAQQQTPSGKDDDIDEEHEQQNIPEVPATTSKESGEGDTFVNRLTETILNNLQIRIHNVRVRYEDDADSNMPIIFGFNLDSIAVVSCNSNWEETWVKTGADPMYKMASLSGLSIYSERTSRLLFSKIHTLKDFKDQMETFINNIKQNDSDDYVSIIDPTEATLKLVLQREGSIDLSKPKLQAELAPGRAHILLDDIQYRNILHTLDYVTNYGKFEKYRSIRPKSAYVLNPEDRMNTPSKRKQWWKYAISAASMNTRKQYFTWDQVEKKKNDRVEYTELYKRHKASFKKKLTSTEKERTHELERLMPTADVIFAREVADAELKVEFERYKKHKESLPKKAVSWFTSWFTGHEELDEEALNEIQVTEEEKRQLEAEIGYNVNDIAQTTQAPPEYIQMIFNVILSGQIELKDSESNRILVRGSLDNLQTSVGIREGGGSVIVNTTLESVSLLDTFTEDTKYPDIIANRQYGQQLVDITVETNPVHRNSDLAIDVALGGVDIYANLQLFQRILAFFMIPSDINLEEIQNVFQTQLEDLQRQAQIQLQIALQNRYRIELKVCMEAPTFYLPEDPTRTDRPILAIDLGNLLFYSEPSDVAREGRLREETLKEKDFYDHYILELANISVAVYQSNDKLMQNELSDLLLDNLSFNLVLSTLIAANPQYPSVAIEALLPSVGITVSPLKLETLSSIINNILNFIDNPTGTRKSMIRKSGVVTLKPSTNMKGVQLPPESDYWCDLRNDGMLFFYDLDDRVKPVATIEINKSASITQDHNQLSLRNTDFVIVVPTPKGDIYFVMGYDERRTADQWFHAINSMYLSISGTSTKVALTEHTAPPLTETLPFNQALKVRLRFVMDNLSVTLLHSPGKRSQEVSLAQLLFTHFSFDLLVRSYDTILTFQLQQVSINEFVNGTKSSPLLKSGDLHTHDGSLAKAQLVVATDRQSEYYSQNADVIINLDFTQFHLFFDPEVISAMIRVIFDFVNLSQEFVSRTLAFRPVEREKRQSTNIVSDLDTERDIVKVTAKLERAALTLVDQGAFFASLSMKETTIGFSMNSQRVIVSGTIGNLQAKDNDTESEYRNVMGIADKTGSLIDFSVQQDLDSSQQEQRPYYPTKVAVRLNSIRFVYLQRLVNRLLSYILDGPLIPCIQEVTSQTSNTPQKSVTTTETEPSSAVALVALDLVLLNPVIVIPSNNKSSERVITNLGKITVSNFPKEVRLEQSGNNEQSKWVETITISLESTNIESVVFGGQQEKVLKDIDFEIQVTRPVYDPSNDLPQVDVVVSVNDSLSMVMNHSQYELLFKIIYGNILEVTATEFRQTEQLKALMTDISKDIQEEQNDSEEEKQEGYKTFVDVDVFFKNLNLTIAKGGAFVATEQIAQMNMHNLHVHHNQKRNSLSETRIVLSAVDAYDLRPSSNSQFKQFVSESSQSGSKEKDIPFIDLGVDQNPMRNTLHINLHVGSPQAIIDPPLIMDIVNYFTEMPPTSANVSPTSVSLLDLQQQKDICIANNVFLGEDIDLSSNRRLFILSNESGEVIIDGQGHIIDFDSSNKIEPMISIAPGMKLSFKNTILRYSDDLVQLIQYGDHNSILSIPKTQSVYSQKLTKDQHAQLKGGSKPDNKKMEVQQTRTIFQGDFGNPQVLFPVNPEKVESVLFVVEGHITVNVDMNPSGKENTYEVFMTDCEAFTRSSQCTSESCRKSANIVEPISVAFKMTEDLSNVNELLRHVNISVKGKLCARVSYNDVKMIMRLSQSFVPPSLPKEEVIQKALESSDDEKDEDVNISPSDEDTNADDDFKECIEHDATRTVNESKQHDISGQFEVVDSDNTSDQISEVSYSGDTSSQASQAIYYKFDLNPYQEVSLLVIDDVNGYDVPLIYFAIDGMTLKNARITQMNTSMDISAQVAFRVVVSFYNMQLATWEPIIEPYNGVLDYERRPTFNTESPVPYTDKIVLSAAQDHDKQDSRPLSVNISRSMLEVVSRTQVAWTRDLEIENVSVTRDPFLIRNHCGFDIFFKTAAQSRAIKLSERSETGFRIGNGSFDLFGEHEHMGMTIEIPAINVRQKVDLRKIGYTCFSNKRQLVIGIIEVDIVNGRKIITVRSGLKVKNNSSQRWTIASMDDSLSSMTIIGEIGPDESLGIPVTVVNGGCLSIKPTDSTGCHWANGKQYSWTNLMLQHSRPMLLKGKSDSNHNNNSYHAVIRAKFARPIPKNNPLLEPASAYLLQEYSCCIEIEAPLVIENLLGRSMRYALYHKLDTNRLVEYATGELGVGAKHYIYEIDISKDVYMKTIPDSETKWEYSPTALIFSPNRSSFDSIIPVSNEKNEELTVHFDYSATSQTIAFHHVTMFAPYWIINRTDKSLTIRDIHGRTKRTQGAQVPMMLTLNRQKDEKISIQIDDSQFSKFFSVANVGVNDYLLLHNGRSNYCVGFTIHLAPGKFNRTKVITFSSRYIFDNRTPYQVTIRQTTSSSTLASIASGSKHSYYWEGSETTVPELQLTIPDTNLDWSTPFKINALGEIPIKLRDSIAAQQGIPKGKILSATIKEQGGSVILTIQEPKKAPYLIDNRLNMPIQISQAGTRQFWNIASGSALGYTWDDAQKSQELIIRIGRVETPPIDLNTVTGLDSQFLIEDNRHVYLSVHANGPTRILRVDTKRFYHRARPMKKTARIFKQRASRSVDTAAQLENRDSQQRNSGLTQKDEEFSLFFTMDVPAIGFSLIDDKKRREVLYIYLEELHLRFEQTNRNQYIEFMMKKAQVDNQLQDCVYPVVLHTEELNDKPFIHFSACRAISDQNAYLFRYLSVAMQQAYLKIEYAFVETVISLVSSLLETDVSDSEMKAAIDGDSAQVDQPPMQQEEEVKYYFDRFELHPIKLSLTFLFNRAETHEEDHYAKAEINRLLAAATNLGFTMAKIEDAPISLSALILKHPFLTQNELLERIQKHYVRQATYDIYKILGSLEILGNPIGLFNDLNTGFREFFYDPAEALIHRPEEFSSELAEGSLKLVSSTIHGTFNTASKLTGNLAKGINFLTFDEEYIREREKAALRRKPKNIKEGITEGAESFAKNVFEGATGIFTKPVKGAKKEGFAGFMKGVGKGLIGIPTKPVSGLVDFATRTNEGISNTGHKEVERIRFPRTFRKDGAIIPYHAASSFGLHILYQLNDGEYIKEGERPILHMPNKDNTKLYMLTNRALLKVSLRDVSDLIWRIPLNSILAMEQRLTDTNHSGRVGILITAPEPKRKLKKYFAAHRPNNIVTKKLYHPSAAQMDQFYQHLLKYVSKAKTSVNDDVQSHQASKLRK